MVLLMFLKLNCIVFSGFKILPVLCCKTALVKVLIFEFDQQLSMLNVLGVCCGFLCWFVLRV